MRLFGRAPRIAIALGVDRLVAVLPHGRRLETTEVADLPRAFGELKTTTALSRASVTVALVPPLVELRRLSLPRLRDEERRRVLTRDAARYFVGAQEPQVIGTEVLPAAGAPVLAAAAPAQLVDAAQYARGTTTFELCSERTHAARQRVARRVSAVMAAAAAACLVLAAGIDFWGLGRQLAAVRARRAGLAPQVAVAMRARDSLEAIVGSVGRLRTLKATSPQWSAFLTDLSDYLPRDAHIVTLRGAADSAVIEGIARQAAGVFQAVQQIPRVGGVRAAASIRQEVAADGSVREQRDLLRRELVLVAAAHDLPASLEGAARTFASGRSHLLSGRDPLGATAGLVSLVGDEARRRGVLLEAIESDGSAPLGDGLVAVQIEVRGRGDLEGLLRWLNALETGPRLLRVERLAVGRLDQGIARDSLDVETLTLGAVIRGYVFVGADGATSLPTV